MKFLWLLFTLIGFNVFAQLEPSVLTNKKHSDWNLLHYQLDVTVHTKNQSITGANTITFKANTDLNSIVIGLQKPLVIDSIVQNKQQLTFVAFQKDYIIQLASSLPKNQIYQLTIYYQGVPTKAKNAPWDGGFTWATDYNGKDFIATANQGIGASVWWPCKEDDSDEVDNGMDILITCPSHVKAVSNGKLVAVQDLQNNSKKYHWKVINPINAYGVSLNVADYNKYNFNYKGLKGNLTCDFYLLTSPQFNFNHLEKNVNRTLEAFEHWFGSYPFYEDSFKIVETPFLGMEHQSAIAYGNQYKNGYLGQSMGNSQWGLTFDYIVVHETAHEWFANSITASNSNDLWIHESFATYAESLFIEHHYGKKAAEEYLEGFKEMVFNKQPILRVYQASFTETDTDVYFKGALMLHTIRQVINNDKVWRLLLRRLSKEYYHQTVTSNQLIDFFQKNVDVPISSIFHHYLTKKDLPKLKLVQKAEEVLYSWENVSDDFTMPVQIKIGNQKRWIYPTQMPKMLKGNLEKLKVDSNFYIDIDRQ